MSHNDRYLLAIDQGTTSTRAMLFDGSARPLASRAVPLRQIYPANGWVEHDAGDIWQAVLECCRTVLRGIAAARVAAIGITNQRETCVIWDRQTGAPLHNAIVWQDRRTAARCAALRKAGKSAMIARKTGLLPDPYFSATKLEWLLKHVKGLGKRDVAFGTIDSWLIWNLTRGAVHATDVTNASRTMLWNLKTRDWDEDLLRLFKVPPAILPQVRESQSDFGAVDPLLLGAPIPILGVAGDQQAACVGQACFTPGDVKSTYGTGCFALVNTGHAVPRSKNRLLATALAGSGGQASAAKPSGRATKQKGQYAIEGSIFIAGAVVQWLRDELNILNGAADSEVLAKQARPAEGLYLVPAFTGLGAPYWDADARGAIVGLTRDSGRAEIVRAALDAVCYQTRDLLEAMRRDIAAAGLKRLTRLKVDGGMVANDWFCQRLADLTGLTVDRPRVTETTALGAAYLAGLGAGLFRSEKDIAARWALDRRFKPALKPAERDRLYAGWQRAVRRVRS
ncbi:MAG: glycerol kinase [Alphaproteobacteria bacterium 64-11]|nr:glycerol kinase GlpK [Alphaproteobacteria bacterium]OJU09690.1 MAG: glycerol kinase [Alphaproteobacteria bacterium 64-11]